MQFTFGFFRVECPDPLTVSLKSPALLAPTQAPSGTLTWTPGLRDTLSADYEDLGKVTIALGYRNVTK